MQKKLKFRALSAGDELIFICAFPMTNNKNGLIPGGIKTHPAAQIK